MLAVASPTEIAATKDAHILEQASPAPSHLAAPALFAAVCFACGDLVAHWWWTPPGPLLVALLLCFAITAFASLSAPRVAIGCAAILLLILGLFCAETQPRPPTT